MKAVVDTNVVAYYVLRTEPFTAEAHRFWDSLSEPMAPSSWEAELANVVWMTVRAGIMTAAVGLERLDLAARLGIRSVPARKLWRGALSRSVATGVAVYDSLFVELAVRERVRLATFDMTVLAAFPQVAGRPGALLRSK